MKWLRKLWSWIESKKSPAPPAPTPSFPHEEVPSNPPVAGDKLLWVPWAVKPKRTMGTSGRYANGYPIGAVIHHSSGRDKTEQEAIDMHDYGVDQGFVYFVIGPTGKVYQSFPLDRFGAHAGTSKYPGLGSGLSSKLVGIEVVNAGKLDNNGKSWFGVTYPDSEIRTLKDESWDCPAGKYKKCTPEQEKSLIELLKWLKNNNPTVFNYDYVLAHSEISGMKTLGYWRKPDIGGSLSMPVRELREKLKKNLI